MLQQQFAYYIIWHAQCESLQLIPNNTCVVQFRCFVVVFLFYSVVLRCSVQYLCQQRDKIVLFSLLFSIQLALEYCGKVTCPSLVMFFSFTIFVIVTSGEPRCCCCQFVCLFVFILVFQAVKLQQAIYGENSPITKKSLDLFTVIYAEMGKEQYSGENKICI